MADDTLTRPDVSAAVLAAGWRVVFTGLAASVPVGSLAQALAVAAAAVAAGGPDADEHLRLDVRPDGVELTLRTASRRTGLSARDVELAHAISAAVTALGHSVAAAGPGRTVQGIELAIDALDIPAIRPFWKAVLGYTDEPGGDGPEDAIVDPAGQGPSIWFQQMDEPRPQRNRIHFDVGVPHDEAAARIEAALAAGGTLVEDGFANSFWVLADAEGNEICVCTWQDRD